MPDCPKSVLMIAGRGFTVHSLSRFGGKHLPWFNLINIPARRSLSEGGNGRVYDPLTGQFLSADNFVQAPDLTQGFNRYGYAFNNPLLYTDPDGENPVILLAMIMGAFMNMGNALINSERQGWGLVGDMAVGAVMGAFTGAIGGSLASIGGGTFICNVLWGAGEGAFMGGLSASLNGGDIGQGMLWGATLGATFASITSGIEAYGNYRNGYGFRTNEGAIKNLLYSKRYNDAINFVKDKFGLGVDLQGRSINYYYDANYPQNALADASTNNVKVGLQGIQSSSHLKSAMVHEYGHLIKDRILDTSRNFIGWNYKNGSYQPKGLTLNDPRNIQAYNVLKTDGPLGYIQEINNIGNMHIKLSVIKATNPLYYEGSWGILNFIPKRFYFSPIITWY